MAETKRNRLEALDLGKSLTKSQSKRRLARLQRRLLQLRLAMAGLLDEPRVGPPLLVTFEGWDAAGKGGVIKRLVARLDPRHVTVTEFAAPTPEEASRHFLWRFWRALPGWGGMSVFDRTWYGRVLVERVEGFAKPEEWNRAYGEIVDFERSLAMEGVTLVKFFLHVSEDEQLRRFESRASDPLRRWKLTEDDWRNRSRRKSYEAAIADMLARTDHEHGRWELVAAESKHFARVEVLRTVIARLEEGMRRAGIEPPEALDDDNDRD
jgi:AMP-polyphosphate phosphotransferase